MDDLRFWRDNHGERGRVKQSPLSNNAMFKARPDTNTGTTTTTMYLHQSVWDDYHNLCQSVWDNYHIFIPSPDTLGPPYCGVIWIYCVDLSIRWKLRWKKCLLKLLSFTILYFRIILDIIAHKFIIKYCTSAVADQFSAVCNQTCIRFISKQSIQSRQNKELKRFNHQSIGLA